MKLTTLSKRIERLTKIEDRLLSVKINPDNTYFDGFTTRKLTPDYLIGSAIYHTNTLKLLPLIAELNGMQIKANLPESKESIYITYKNAEFEVYGTHSITVSHTYKVGDSRNHMSISIDIAEKLIKPLMEIVTKVQYNCTPALVEHGNRNHSLIIRHHLEAKEKRECLSYMTHREFLESSLKFGWIVDVEVTREALSDKPSCAARTVKKRLYVVKKIDKDFKVKPYTVVHVNEMSAIDQKNNYLLN